MSSTCHTGAVSQHAELQSVALRTQLMSHGANTPVQRPNPSHVGNPRSRSLATENPPECLFSSDWSGADGELLGARVSSLQNPCPAGTCRHANHPDSGASAARNIVLGSRSSRSPHTAAELLLLVEDSPVPQHPQELSEHAETKRSRAWNVSSQPQATAMPRWAPRQIILPSPLSQQRRDLSLGPLT
jgi:hypothetical protein